jgi:hypothetical protein
MQNLKTSLVNFAVETALCAVVLFVLNAIFGVW